MATDLLAKAGLQPRPEALTEIKGSDLFSSPADAYAHCVSRDFHMGKGIATLFKQRYGRVEELLAQGKTVGQTAVLIRKGTPRYVYYCKWYPHIVVFSGSNKYFSGDEGTLLSQAYPVITTTVVGGLPRSCCDS